MLLTGINHLAFITEDMEKTIRFYRDLLGMELHAGIGHGGYRHYFFRCGNTQVAFFEYEGASPMQRKFHGSPTRLPLGFDHVSFTVATREALFRMKDDDPMAIVAEGADPQPGIWPAVEHPTPPEAMVAHGGNGHAMRATFLREGIGRMKDDAEGVAMAAE